MRWRAFRKRPGHRLYNLVLRNICGERLCCDAFLVHGFGFSGHVESYTAEEETPSSTAKALHVLPSRDYQSPIARRSDGKYLYSRTLAYVFLQDGTHLNAEIIRQGYGFAVSSSPPLKYQNEFRRLEREAREQRRGLWAIATKGNDG